MQAATAIEPFQVSGELATADVATFCEVARTPVEIRRRSERQAFANQPTWQRCRPGSLAVGLSSDSTWVRFVIESALPRTHTVYLEQPMPWVDRQQVWLSYPNGSELSMQAGKMLPFQKRPVPAMNVFFPVRIKLGEAIAVLMRIDSIGSVSVGLRLHKQSSYEARRDMHNLFVGFLAGGTLLILLYNFFVYTALRDLKYVVYVPYGLSVLLFCGALYGFNYELMPSTNADQAQVHAHRLRQAFSEIAISVNDTVVTVTGSLGVAESGSTDDGVESVLERADVALYTAKDRARDRIVRAASATG